MRKFHFVFIVSFLFVFSCHSKSSEENKSSSDLIQESAAYSYHQKDSVDSLKEILPVKTDLELYLDSLGFIDISVLDSTIRIDLKYATTDNFTKKILYKSLNRAYLHPIAAEKLMRAQTILKQNNPDLVLLVYDAARPLSVQKEMFDVVKGTKYQAYVANPQRTGLHNYGIAVDLTIYDLTLGKPLDMGTEFDFFGKLAGINNEELFVNQGLLSKQQFNNRGLLRKVMLEAGFLSIRGEWWHFNALSLSAAKQSGILIK